MLVSMDSVFDDGRLLVWDLTDPHGPQLLTERGKSTLLNDKYLDAILQLEPNFSKSNTRIVLRLPRPSLFPVSVPLKSPLKLRHLVSAIDRFYKTPIKAADYPQIAQHEPFRNLSLTTLKRRLKTNEDLLTDYTFLEGFRLEQGRIHPILGS